MGLQISEIVPKEEISLESLSGKIIAVDAFNTIYQFLTTIRQPDGTPLMDRKKRITSHLSGLFYRTINLMTLGIKPVFVFDGKAPELKEKTHELRAKLKEEAAIKFETAEEIEEKAKWAARIAVITNEMIEESKILLEALGIPVIQAPGEGEAQASYMAKQQDCWAVASQDYDSLLFGAPRLIQNVTMARKRRLPSGLFVSINPELIELEKVLNTLQITREQLICLGILVGTDYNPGGVKGIGQKNALKIVRQFKQPAIIFNEVAKEKTIDFDWKEIFELFMKPNVIKKYDLKFKSVNIEKIKKILVEEHDFSEERIDNSLKRLNEQKEKTKQKKLF
ncbi:MAG: flap endonuclease-1 [Candidatus Pacearchaeota archaeon]